MPSWELAVGDSVALAEGAPDNGCLRWGDVGSVCTVADEEEALFKLVTRVGHRSKGGRLTNRSRVQE